MNERRERRLRKALALIITMGLKTTPPDADVNPDDEWVWRIIVRVREETLREVEDSLTELRKQP